MDWASAQGLQWLTTSARHLMRQALTMFYVNVCIIHWKLLKDHTLLVYEYSFHKNNSNNNKKSRLHDPVTAEAQRRLISETAIKVSRSGLYFHSHLVYNSILKLRNFRIKACDFLLGIWVIFLAQALHMGCFLKPKICLIKEFILKT